LKGQAYLLKDFGTWGISPYSFHPDVFPSWTAYVRACGDYFLSFSPLFLLMTGFTDVEFFLWVPVFV